jgi:hypothetical protein
MRRSTWSGGDGATGRGEDQRIALQVSAIWSDRRYLDVRLLESETGPRGGSVNAEANGASVFRRLNGVAEERVRDLQEAVGDRGTATRTRRLHSATRVAAPMSRVRHLREAHERYADTISLEDAKRYYQFTIES